MGIVEELAKNATSVNPFGLPRSADCASVIGGKDPVVFGSARYYALCGFGGMLSCGLTHTAIVPLDLIKCRIQVNPEKYKGILGGFRTTLSEEGVRALGKGWAPTLVGYSLQGLGKFGFYELFKILYTDMLGEEKAYLWRTSLYLAASASAEFFADIMLAPMEATKVRIQTSPGAPPTLRGCAPLIYKSEGLRGFYKGLPPLWMRQIPYTMMKFACFERTVELLYAKVVPKPRDQCSKGEQLVVTFIAGYIAGVFCAVVSHPADTIVSKLNQDAGVWGGLVPRIVMIGTLTALQWFIYDTLDMPAKGGVGKTKKNVSVPDIVMLDETSDLPDLIDENPQEMTVEEETPTSNAEPEMTVVKSRKRKLRDVQMDDELADTEELAEVKPVLDVEMSEEQFEEKQEAALKKQRNQTVGADAETRKVPIPSHRYNKLRSNWSKITAPIVQQLKLQIRFNLKSRRVEIRCPKGQQPNLTYLQKAEDFVRAFSLGFEVQDAIALIRLDHIFLESFEVTDVKPLQGEHLSRAIGRIAGKDGRTKMTIENVTKTRIIIAGSKIHVMGAFTNLRLARHTLCSLILGRPPSKVYGNLRNLSSRIKDTF
ncbi:Phosphate carrier protein, mitochondrial [Aphelenchoides besseyi]|nr:Phosphate carrier protein, mitochondrial [Aphelenchoides besseyi]